MADCTDSYISDGFCDYDENVAECNWDGGDCCACDCVTTDYTCGINGYDCLDPSACGNSDDGEDDASVGAIVGGVIGGLLLIVAVVVLVVLFKKGHLKRCECDEACDCSEACACCEPGAPAATPAPAPAPAGVMSAPSVGKAYPGVHSSAAVALPPLPAYEGPGDAQLPAAQAYPVPAETAAPPAYEGPVVDQYPAPA